MSAKDTTMITGAKSVECLPNGVDCERFQPSPAQPESHRLLLIGSFAHLPNLLALEFFLRDVWPLEADLVMARLYGRLLARIAAAAVQCVRLYSLPRLRA